MWLLLHHAGFLTYPHHDANGLMTYILPEVGWKFWGIMEPKNITGMETREQLSTLFKRSLFDLPKQPKRPTDASSKSDNTATTAPKKPVPEEPLTPPYHEKADMHIIFARPGDLM